MKEAAVSEDALKKAAEFVEAEEGATHRLKGMLALFVTVLAVGVSIFHLYTAYDIVATQTLRPVHVACILVLTFLLFPIARGFRNRIMPWDWAMAAASIAVIVYMLQGGDDFTDRSSLPNQTDVIVGAIFIVLVLEAARRTSGWIMPVEIGRAHV